MEAGLNRLRLAPDAFWKMTPRELAMALGAPAGAPVPDRAALAALIAAFPD